MNLAPAGGPTALVIGGARCGTTLLTDVLVDQLGFASPRVKEPHFLAFFPDRPRFTGPGDAATVNDEAIIAPDGWRRALRRSGPSDRRVDGSVSTMYGGETSLANIARFCPDAPMVALLRQPADRAKSAHALLRMRGLEPLEVFDDALEAEPERLEAGWHYLWAYSGAGEYDRWLTPFVETCGDRLLVVFFEDLVATPAETIPKVAGHLGVPCPSDPVLPERAVNDSGSIRTGFGPLVHHFYRSSALRRAARAVPTSVRRRARSTVVQPRVGGGDDGPVPELLAELVDRQRAGLATLLGVTAPW